MRKLLPILLAVIGVGTGVGVGLTLKPPPLKTAKISLRDAPSSGSKTSQVAQGSGKNKSIDPKKKFDYAKLNNQFVVPVLRDGKVISLVVLSLSLEVLPGGRDQVFAKEPKLRDAFLQVLFDHANAGGFDGDFTNSNKMMILRDALYEVAKKILGPTVSNVLILNFVRQDVA